MGASPDVDEDKRVSLRERGIVILQLNTFGDKEIAHTTLDTFQGNSAVAASVLIVEEVVKR